MRKQTLTIWTLWLVAILLSLWAVGQMSPDVTHELLPWIADDGKIVWQELVSPRRNDLFQIPASLLPTPNVRLVTLKYPYQRIGSPNDVLFYLDDAGRPQISSDGEWVVYFYADTSVEPPLGRVAVRNLNSNDTRIISRKYRGWVDSDNDSIRDSPPDEPQLSDQHALLPAIGVISGSTLAVAFFSRDPEINDPEGNGQGPPADIPSNDTRWIVYLFTWNLQDEARVGAIKVRFIPDPSDSSEPLLVRLGEVRLSVDKIGLRVLITVMGSAPRPWKVYLADFSNWSSPSTYLLAESDAPFPSPSISASNVALTATGNFVLNPNNLGSRSLPAGIWVIKIDSLPATPLLGILTNGVNGAPVLSRDGQLLAFHSTMTAYRVNNGAWIPLPNKRNAVDDVFVFDLTGTLLWTSLFVRGVPTNSPFGPILSFTPCINPALPSSNKSGLVDLIAFQEIVNGQSRIRIVEIVNPKDPVRR